LTASASFSFRELPRAATGERWKMAGWVLAAWTLVGLFRAVDRYFSDPFQLHRLEFGLWEALAQSLLASTIWALFTPPVVWLARRCVPTRDHWIVPIATLIAGGALFAVAHCAAYQLAYPLLMGFPLVVSTQLAALPQMLRFLLPTHLITYAAIVGATWTLSYSRLSRERELRASQIKTRLLSARLEALKMQLHPHFLFNTLNSILPLVFRDRDAASRTVVRLSDLLRLSLQNEGSDLIPLRKELELLKVYLEIQQTRFQDRLTVRLDVEPGIADALVPNLILQPLVENAIKHGIAARPGSGRVEVHARREAERLRLLVRDDGPGPRGAAAAATSSRPSEGGVGLRNTRDRLELLYPGRHEFEFRAAPDRGTEVALTFPLAMAPSAPRAGVPRRVAPVGDARLAPIA
jgi:two-component system LytT family sensor kinase